MPKMHLQVPSCLMQNSAIALDGTGDIAAAGVAIGVPSPRVCHAILPGSAARKVLVVTPGLFEKPLEVNQPSTVDQFALRKCCVVRLQLFLQSRISSFYWMRTKFFERRRMP